MTEKIKTINIAVSENTVEKIKEKAKTNVQAVAIRMALDAYIQEKKEKKI